MRERVEHNLSGERVILNEREREREREGKTNILIARTKERERVDCVIVCVYT